MLDGHPAASPREQATTARQDELRSDSASDAAAATSSHMSAFSPRSGPSRQLLEPLRPAQPPALTLEPQHATTELHGHHEQQHAAPPTGGDESLHAHDAAVADDDDAADSVDDDGEDSDAHTGAVPYIADDVPNVGPHAQDVESVLESAPFGFAQVDLDMSRATAKRSSLVVISSLAKELAAVQLSTQRESARRRREIHAQRKKLVLSALRVLLTVLALLDALYVLVSVPLRIGFHFDPHTHALDRGVWTRELTIYSVLDIVGEVVRLTYVYVERKSIGATFARKKSASSQVSTRSGKSMHSVGRRQTRAVAPQLATSFSVRGRRLSIPNVSLFSVREDDHAATAMGGGMTIDTASVIQREVEAKRMPLLFKVFLCLPLDVVAAIALDPNWIHLARAVKLVVAGYSLPLLYASVLRTCRKFHVVRLLSFSTLHLPFQLFWLGLYLCHLSACGYMLIAHIECGVDFAQCSRTPVPGCWVLKDRLERGSFWRQYVRTMYWASKTVTTLGQGDLVPTTQFETDYCIVVQFISGLWATAFLSSCSFYFSRRDADVNECASTRLEQALKFLRNRHVPTELAAHIRAYHQYLQRTRNGIEETRILADLPVHYHKQCSSYVTMRLIRQVPFFVKQPKAFMKTVLEMIESDFLSPNQTILGVYDVEELIVVARGEIRVFDVEHKLLVQTIETGQWYAEHALFQDRLSRYELIAGTFCEVYCLTKQSFVAAMEQHFPKMKIALLQAQYAQQAHLSRFRHVWRRWKVALTIYLAIEVPFDMAFDWRFGALGSSDYTWRQYAAYVVSLLVEVFFYVDVYLRACEFARPKRTPGALEPPAHKLQEALATKNLKSARTSSLRLNPGLIMHKSELLTYYLTHGDVFLDFATTLPISMIWTLLPKENVAFETMYYMRFFRLLALVRLAKLKKLMRKIMQNHDFSPASQLLTNVIVFCVLMANAMGCLFFLLADFKGFDFGLPPSFGGAGSISADKCLEDASVFHNCTWFMFDQSVFAIQARYIRSLHWSLVLLSTVGYGDILSFSDSECFLGFWWIFLGALICYFTACAVSSVVSQVTVIDTVQSSRSEAVNRALVQAGVSNWTRRVIRRHFETNWARNGSVLQEAELLQHLPRSQRFELACSLYLADLCRCYLFASIREQSTFLRDVTLIMRSEIFVPKVVLLNHGHLAREMYFIQSGDVEVLIPRVETRQRRYQSDLLALNELPSTRWLLSPSAAESQRPQSFLGRLRARFSSARNSDPTSAPSSQAAQQRARRGIWIINGATKLVPIAVLRRGDCFGEESVLPDERFESRVSVRTVTSTQVAVLARDDLLALLARYPEEATAVYERIKARRRRYADLFRRMNSNFSSRDKLKGFLGPSASLYVENKVHANHIRGPETLFYKFWRTVQGAILLYNFFQISFRIAFLPNPSDDAMLALTLVDYAIDALFAADIYLKWHRLGFTLYGDKIVDLAAIRQRYRSTWFRLDCWSLLPLYYQGDYFVMTLCRLPRLLRTPQLLEFINELEERIRQRILRSSSMALLSVFDLFKFLLLFLSAAHQIGSIYYTIGRLMLKYELAPASWITADTVLNAYPDNIAVHYVRSMYWCLETFTVVCFGDVLARNAVETFYSSMVCVIGWVCIGQVMGKITSLMAVMDQDRHEHNERVEAFEQYAKKKHLPSFLRERAIEGLEFKSKCLIDLAMAETFADLPAALHVLLFDELYGDYVRNVPELRDALSEPQLQALANALRLELYLPEDLIIEEGRIGTKLFIMKSGAAEIFSAHSQMVFAAVHEGVVFGDLAFFLDGMKQLVSVRASRSCQVLYLHRRDWLELWSCTTRAAIERKLVPAMARKYRAMSRAFLNIFKNFELAKTGALTHRRRGGGVEHSARSAIAEEADGDDETLDERNERANSNDDDDDDGEASVSSRTKHVFRFMQSTKRSIAKGGRRKLSVYLGLPLRTREPTLSTALQSAITARIEAEWERHERNLHVLAQVDKQPGQQQGAEADAVQEIAEDAPFGSDVRDEASMHETIHETAQDRAAMDAGVDLPSRIATIEALHHQHLPPGISAAHVNENARTSALTGGHSYAKHLETLRARSKARKHQSVFQSDGTADSDANPYEIWVEPPLPPAFCMENSSFRHVWNAVMLAICCYYVLVVPFRISFDFEFLAITGQRETIVSWFVIEYILDVLCIVDFVLQRSYFTYIYKGEVVTDRARICAHYWRDGTYVSDLVCILPFEVLAPVYSALRRYQGQPWDVTWYRVAVFRTNKMLRIARLHDLSERFQRTLVYDWKWTFITPSAVYFTRFAFDFALGAHWVACFFYSFSYNTFIEDGRLSWLTTPGMLAYAGCTGIDSIGDVPVIEKFARSYHFSMGAITTVSYGDIAPQNAIETALGTVVIVVSIVLFGMLAGGFFHLYEMELGQRADYEERVARVANYVVFHRFHARIWTQLQVYFAVHWQESKGMDEDELLRGLPTSVRQDIILYVKREFVVQMKLFATCEEAFVRAVVAAFQQELFVRHDVIIAEGDTGRSLYVIENGTVLVRITKKQRKATARSAAAIAVVSALRPPADETIEVVKGRFDFFGEKSLILDVPRSATCVALSSCSMLILTVEQYREILDDFPEYREHNMREWIFANSDVWFSFPNTCPFSAWSNKTAACRAATRKGLCDRGVLPNGVDCTYNYRILGYLALDDLVGITSMVSNSTNKPYGNFTEFCKDGGVEFMASEDGVWEESIDFWRKPQDESANKARAKLLVEAYQNLTSGAAKSGQIAADVVAHMLPLPTVAELAAENPPCYKNVAKCNTKFGCKRDKYAQLCTVCTSAADGCVAPPSSFTFPTLAKAVGSNGNTGSANASNNSTSGGKSGGGSSTPSAALSVHRASVVTLAATVAVALSTTLLG